MIKYQRRSPRAVIQTIANELMKVYVNPPGPTHRLHAYSQLRVLIVIADRMGWSSLRLSITDRLELNLPATLALPKEIEIEVETSDDSTRED